ncbi:hypothetical protein [Paracoccus aerodenitrificans]|uniref:hypothetical protein n=1 Tax=Paracoccus aerodenitrificans TaxID=3017781 RepID=UPI0022F037B3|nr:hypothetical protein [Paracoccus aerodenitrificans]WBU64928.1 hypothetical protein PAE61_05705 [Paracoccus aerodenitrificans]
MPRPENFSDEDVLAVALELLETDCVGFTLSDLARDVSLSLAPLIQRFGNRDTILRRMTEFEVEETRAWNDRFPLKRGRTGLWQFLEEIVNGMGAGEGLSARVQIAAL